MHQNLIQLENVSKVYPMGTEDVHALRDVSVSIEEGEFVTTDEPSLRLVALNLLRNAIAFSHSHGEVTVAAEKLGDS